MPAVHSAERSEQLGSLTAFLAGLAPSPLAPSPLEQQGSSRSLSHSLTSILDRGDQAPAAPAAAAMQDSASPGPGE